MLISSLVLGSIGIIIFISILFSFNKLLNKNESGFLHLLMTFMYICWLPIPLATFILLKSYSFMIVGTIFGVLSLLLLIITMVLQASHLSYSAKQNNGNPEMWNINDKWMMDGLLGSQIELLANVLKGIWIIFLTIAFWFSGQIIFGILGSIYSLITIVYLFMLINISLVNEIPFLKKVKLNFILINLETFSWYLVLLVWIIVTI
ncbi:MAG: hypothetical protein FH761_08745 [Firmicutes bacterium]|nr:hypothetical protein [Bacillota bacterium]